MCLCVSDCLPKGKWETEKEKKRKKSLGKTATKWGSFAITANQALARERDRENERERESIRDRLKERKREWKREKERNSEYEKD